MFFSGAGNVGMLRHLLLDMDKTRSLTAEWGRIELEIRGVKSRFMSSEGGLTLVHPARYDQILPD